MEEDVVDLAHHHTHAVNGTVQRGSDDAVFARCFYDGFADGRGSEDFFERDEDLVVFLKLWMREEENSDA